MSAHATAHYPFAAVEERSPSSGILTWTTEFTLLAIFVVSSLPEVWSKPLRFGEVSLLNVLFCISAVLAIAAGLRGGMRQAGYLAFAGIAMLYMAVLGRLNQHALPFDEKNYYADLLTFLGLIAGYAWSASVHPQRLAKFLRVAAIVTCVILAGTHVLLFLNILTPVWAGQRVFVWSVFSAIWWITALMPVIVATETPGRGLLSTKATRVIVLACLATATASAMFTGTRSVLLQVLICVLVCLRPLARTFIHAYWIVWVALLCGLGLYFVADNQALNIEFLSSRMQETQVKDEQRFLELQMMFDQLLPDVWIGQGFGVSFTSPVIVNNSPLAIAPHIAVTATLLKGGVVSFAGLILVPAVIAIWKVVTTTRSTLREACWAGVLLYITGASMSGGWGYFHLFLFGLFLGLAQLAPSSRPAR